MREHAVDARTRVRGGIVDRNDDVDRRAARTGRGHYVNLAHRAWPDELMPERCVATVASAATTAARSTSERFRGRREAAPARRSLDPDAPALRRARFSPSRSPRAAPVT